MNRYLGTILLLTALAFLLVDCASTPDTEAPPHSGPYLGQTPPHQGCVVFAPGVASDGLINRDVAISPTGDEIYFCAASASLATILVTHLRDGKWSTPEVASFCREPHTLDFEPCLSEDGKELYFLSNRPVGNERPVATWARQDIWRVTREDKEWGEPQHLGSPVNTDDQEFFPSLTRSGDLYFCRSKPGSRIGQIYCARKTETGFAEPEPLPNVINNPGSSYNAFVDPDERYLIFCATGREDQIGLADYYISYRDGAEGWGAPINLGEPVNRPETHASSPYVSPDGTLFFFASDRTEFPEFAPDSSIRMSDLLEIYDRPGNGRSDIYWMKVGFPPCE